MVAGSMVAIKVIFSTVIKLNLGDSSSFTAQLLCHVLNNFREGI